MGQWSEARVFQNTARTAELTVCAHVDCIPFTDAEPRNTVNDLVVLSIVGQADDAAALEVTLRRIFIGMPYREYLTFAGVAE